MDQNTDNVINLGNKTGYPIFNPILRKQIEASAQPFTEKPDEVVNAMEGVICKHLVTAIRRGASKIGEALGKKITNVVDEAFNG